MLEKAEPGVQFSAIHHLPTVMANSDFVMVCWRRLIRSGRDVATDDPRRSRGENATRSQRMIHAVAIRRSVP